MLAIFVIVGLLVGFMYALKLYVNGRNDFWPKKGMLWVDSNKISSFFKRITLQESILDFHKKLYESQPNEKYFGYNELRSTIWYVRDLDLVRKVMVKDFDHFMDRRSFVAAGSKGDPYMTRMLLNTTGQEWRDLRAFMSPTFATGKIRRMFEFFNAVGENLSSYIKATSENESNPEPNTVDFQDCFGRYTAEAIASIAFGQPTDVFQKQDSAFRNMMKRFQRFNLKRMFKFVLHATLPSVARLFNVRVSDEQSMNFFSKIVMNNIRARRNVNGPKRQDFLQLLLDAQSGQLQNEEAEPEKLEQFEKDAIIKSTSNGKSKESAVVLDDDTVIAQCVLFFAAGADTIETVLTYCVYHLALQPEIQEKLAADVTAAMEENDGKLTYDMVNHIEYLDMVLSETLRMHTPGFFAERVVTQDYTIPDTKIVVPTKSRVQISIVGIHHDKKYYDNPTKFDPEHFTTEKKNKRHPYAYLPFGQGPRNCIAMRFALTESKAAIAHLVYNFRLEVCTKTQIPVKVNPRTFKPDGMWLKVIPRR